MHALLFEKGFASEKDEGGELQMIHCQLLATSLANFCHRLGKTLPHHWQTFAKALARCWQSNNYGSRLLIPKTSK